MDRHQQAPLWHSRVARAWENWARGIARVRETDQLGCGETCRPDSKRDTGGVQEIGNSDNRYRGSKGRGPGLGLERVNFNCPSSPTEPAGPTEPARSSMATRTLDFKDAKFEQKCPRGRGHPAEAYEFARPTRLSRPNRRARICRDRRACS